jgi:archaellum component FlaF (FlaF/FlaG flagellin family)
MKWIGRLTGGRQLVYPERGRGLLPALILTLLLGPSALAPCALAGITQRVSVSTGGEEGGLSSEDSAISANGRYVAFTSWATNLVSGDTNGELDVFVRDRLAGTTERVSVSSSGAEGNGRSEDPSISADGTYVAFSSYATNLVAGDTNNYSDVFVHNRQTGTTERVSVSTGGGQSSDQSLDPAISADGRYVAFDSTATDLVPGDTNTWRDVFVHDREAGTTERVSVSSGGGQGNSDSYDPSISADGRYVAFQSWTSNLVPGDTNGRFDVFVRDRQTATTERVSVATSGEQGNDHSDGWSISADGRYVAFSSFATDLVAGDTNNYCDIFLRDRQAGTTERVSVSTGSGEGNDNSWFASVSADGRYVAFDSEATNLVPGDANGSRDTFVRDRQAGTTERVSVSTGGSQANSSSWLPSCISADGRYVAFGSWASNLVPGDTNGTRDVFVRDRGGFADVPSTHWAFQEVSVCYNANIVKGYDDDLYHPEYTVTRDQMAVYISRGLAGGDSNIPNGPATPSFSDVPSNHWAYKHIEYAVSQNVVKGYDDGTYQPGLTVDRGTMAVYVARAMVAPGGDAAIPDPVPPATFPDVATTYWAYKQVEYCVGQGVVKGYDDGNYHPANPVTRDQMAVYIARAFGLL